MIKLQENSFFTLCRLSMTVNAAFHEFCHFLQERSGITLSPSKAYLVESRLLSLMQAKNINSIDELVLALRQFGSHHLQQEVIERMTTNETFWFRDQYPFEYFVKYLLPGGLSRGSVSPKTFPSHTASPFSSSISPFNPSTRLRVWCAACSAGQEPYSLAMLASQNHVSQSIELLATDLSERILDKARQGIYNDLEMARGLQPDYLKRFFHRHGESHWQVEKSIRDLVQFRRLNLISDQYPVGRWDVIFCRNVLIYFDVEMKRQILLKLHRALAPGGVMFLGASEGIQDMSEYFELINCTPGIAFRAKQAI